MSPRANTLNRATVELVDPYTNAALDARIREAAVQYRPYAPVLRVAFFDIAYPKDCAELVAMRRGML